MARTQSAVSKAKQNLKEQRERLTKQAANLDRFAEEIAKIEAFAKVAIPKGTEYAIYVGASAWSTSANVVISVKGLEGFKDVRLLNLLLLAETALGVNFNRTADWLGGDALNRDFNGYIYPDPANGSEYIDLTISAYVKTDSPTCRKVQVGIEVQEVPKYEIQCD